MRGSLGEVLDSRIENELSRGKSGSDAGGLRSRYFIGGANPRRETNRDYLICLLT